MDRPVLRAVPDLPDDAPAQDAPPRRRAVRGVTVRLAEVEAGVPRIGGMCTAAQKRCGHHSAPDAEEVVAALAWLGRAVPTADLVAALLELRGCTGPLRSEGLKNHLGRLAKDWPDGCGHGAHVETEPGRSRQWRPCADPCQQGDPLH